MSHTARRFALQSTSLSSHELMSKARQFSYPPPAPFGSPQAQPVMLLGKLDWSLTDKNCSVVPLVLKPVQISPFLFDKYCLRALSFPALFRTNRLALSDLQMNMAWSMVLVKGSRLRSGIGELHESPGVEESAILILCTIIRILHISTCALNTINRHTLIISLNFAKPLS